MCESLDETSKEKTFSFSREGKTRENSITSEPTGTRVYYVCTTCKRSILRNFLKSIILVDIRQNER